MSSLSIRPRSTAAARRRRPVAELAAASAAATSTRMESRARGRVHAGLRALRGVAWLGLVAYAAHSVLHLGGTALGVVFEDWVFNALFAVAALVCLARALLVGEERLPWLVLGLGLTCWSIGQIAFTLAPPADSAPFPSLSDVFWLAFYPTSFVTLVLLVRARVRVFYASLWLDGLVGALAVSALAATFVLPPLLAGTGDSLPEVIANLSYPLGDLLLVVFVVAVLALTTWRPGRVLGFLAAGFALGAVVDTLSLWWSATGHGSDQTPFDALWPASALLLAHAAWQPAHQALTLRLCGWRQLAFPVLFALSALGLLVYQGVHGIPTGAYVLATLTLVGVLGRLGLSFGENMRLAERSRREAMTDALTGLGNRRALVEDLDEALRRASFDPGVLAIFDLNGFKRYNDTFGHPAGDALLTRLGHSLAEAVASLGTAYRLGGDEFCALLRTSDPVAQVTVAEALCDRGQAFVVSSAYGTVTFPQDAQDASTALQLADERLYVHKNGSSRPDALQQARDVLMQVLRERQPDLHSHLSEVAELARDVGRRLGLSPAELDDMARAAELHDIGKMAVPDAILQKASGLDTVEAALMHQHTIVGERVLAAAPALRAVAKLVRHSHERYDGKGYPDGLSGDEIPLGARIIAVCDAFDAMTADRPYQPAISERSALAELRRCAGGQFDPTVVEAFDRALDDRRPRAAAESDDAVRQVA